MAQTRKTDSLNEALKQREAAERQRLLNEVEDGAEKVMALDDTQRVKLLSPGRLVVKRFLHNKLAIVGSVILIVMFVFSFICPLFYPYSQTQIFRKYDKFNVNYASATERTEYVSYSVGGADVHYSVKNRINSYASEMETRGLTEMAVADSEGAEYLLTHPCENVYILSAVETEDAAVYHAAADVCTYDKLSGGFTWVGGAMDSDFCTAVSAAVASGAAEFEYDGGSYTVTSGKKNRYNVASTGSGLELIGAEPAQGFVSAAETAVAEGAESFEIGGVTYSLHSMEDGIHISAEGGMSTAIVASTYVFDAVSRSTVFDDGFKTEALLALVDDGVFEYGGESYSIAADGESLCIYGADGEKIADLSDYSVKRYSGQDTINIDLKERIREVIGEMNSSGSTEESFVYELPAMDEESNYIYDENGELTYEDTELEITRTPTQYVITCEQTTYLIDIHASPSAEHWFGTDGDGMDILARAMYGGRISLMVGFVVVIIETLLGTLLGGIAGFFGGWVDTLIMRLVDIFYCIPSMPILIIIGALLDAMKVNAYVRLIYLMAVLGVLGWAGIARLVRGQILSLREQEFMIAEEATGMRAARRIFRHLIPNVMPQLIVSATMGLGSVIITESTLSFLGLGVKHPLATWGNMINSVTGSSEDMIRYTYIWIPIGLLICLTVIAFNFVGDGLRDAFDPKMKQ